MLVGFYAALRLCVAKDEAAAAYGAACGRTNMTSRVGAGKLIGRAHKKKRLAISTTR
jgi:hypothetical protein